jgi:hypothetical protein
MTSSINKLDALSPPAAKADPATTVINAAATDETNGKSLKLEEGLRRLKSYISTIS